MQRHLHIYIYAAVVIVGDDKLFHMFSRNYLNLIHLLLLFKYAMRHWKSLRYEFLRQSFQINIRKTIIYLVMSFMPKNFDLI